MIRIENAREAKENLKERLKESGIEAAVGIGKLEDNRPTLEIRTEKELSQEELDMISEGSPVEVRHKSTGKVRAGQKKTE